MPYDTAVDPHEIRNLVDSPQPEHREALARLRAALDTWVTDTGDRGAVPEAPAVVAPFAIILTAGCVLMLLKGGLLTLMVWLAVLVVLRDTPWTLALTRWYAGPTWLSAALLAGLPGWGFRNVLGRKSTFAAEL